jgi:hypothetical protein
MNRLRARARIAAVKAGRLALSMRIAVAADLIGNAAQVAAPGRSKSKCRSKYRANDATPPPHPNPETQHDD